MVEVRRLGLPGVLEIRPRRISDERGFFSETWSAAGWAEAGITDDFVQDNHSCSRQVGVLRGLHYQKPPFAQAKLVRVTRGSVFDVAVDIRHGSPTFGQWAGLTLSVEDWNQLYVPAGFAHGFVTLRPDTEVQYKVSSPYSPDHDRTIRFDDPAIGIDWPVTGGALTLSAKDEAGTALADHQTGFTYP